MNRKDRILRIVHLSLGMLGILIAIIALLGELMEGTRP